MQVEFLKWVFQSDVISTKSLYSSIERDETQMWCSYDSFNHYQKYRDSVFPKPVLDLLLMLGIDCNKEMNIIDQGAVEANRVWYETWYDYKGEVLSGPVGWDMCIDLSRDFSMCVVEIDEDSRSHYFGDEKPVVSLHFIIKVPL
jgi:hypothetical protein